MDDHLAIQDLLSRWWFHYDEGDFDALKDLLTSDVHFTCRTDTGTTDYEEFVRADIRGLDDVMAWQRQHRLDSPYPLRHHLTNVHLTASSLPEVRFASYIFVTQITEGVTNLSTGVVMGTATAGEGPLRIKRLEVTLDTMTSQPLREVKPELS